jgi:hypothetical protein
MLTDAGTRVVQHALGLVSCPGAALQFVSACAQQVSSACVQQYVSACVQQVSRKGTSPAKGLMELALNHCKKKWSSDKVHL